MMIRAPFNLAISAYFVFKLNNKIAAIFAFILPILGLGLYLIVMIAHPRFRKMMLKFDNLNANLDENIDGIRVV